MNNEAPPQPEKRISDLSKEELQEQIRLANEQIHAIELEANMRVGITKGQVMVLQQLADEK